MNDFRNPFTPKEGDSQTPQQFLQQLLDFYAWDIMNLIEHQPACTDEAHHQVMSNYLCCAQHIQQCIEDRLLKIAGCKAGIFVEPKHKSYRLWLNWAEERLAELQNGEDRLTEWTQRIDEYEGALTDWLTDRSDMYAYEHRPTISLYKYVVACKEHNFSPDLKILAKISHNSEITVNDCWRNPGRYRH